MSSTILLDAGPLGMIAHPRRSSAMENWLARISASGGVLVVPEITDYEVRRELIRAGSIKGVRRLDRLAITSLYLPISTGAMKLAAEFWAQSRRQGYQTGTDHDLDADVILAAQAAILAETESNVVIATTNVRHLGRFAPAAVWHTIK